MLGALLVILVLLWFLGYIHVQGLSIPDTILFTINGQPISLWDILILIVVAAIIGVLPSPFRQIAGVMLISWILSMLGIVAIVGLSSLLVLAVIVGLIVYLVQGAL